MDRESKIINLNKTMKGKYDIKFMYHTEKVMLYDRIIIGAGMYGLYAAIESAKKGYQVLVIDIEDSYFNRGSYINQARLHNGYHYPRSYSTAKKSADYFQRFTEDYKECINSSFEQIYAVASDYSWTNGKQFQTFCDNLDVTCDEIEKRKYFNPHTIDKAFFTEEYSFDAKILGDMLYSEAKERGVSFNFGSRIDKIVQNGEQYTFNLSCGKTFESNFVLNATYAGVNLIHKLLGFEMLPIKYELCEVILCKVSDNIKNVGLTVMDGPFFSVMPFGLSGYHSITTVSRTPHFTCYDSLPAYDCQGLDNHVVDDHELGCISCQTYPESAFTEMKQIAKRYLSPNIDIEYVSSLFTVKPIMKASEIDDSRPTIIKQYSEKPYFYTVFSGKINTMYDLDVIL